MQDTRSIDEDLLRRLPLPLAQLYRRAHNAKTALERHQAAYYLWEAALKLFGSVALVEYAEIQDHDPELARRLENLARPTVGHWWEFVRRLVPVLADAGDPQFARLRELVLGRTRDDLPRVAGLDAALRELLEDQSGTRVTVRLTELFERLVRYRNRELGHGAAGQRATEFYDRMGRALLAGVAELLAHVNVLAGRRLVYVADVRRAVSGIWLIEQYELAGETARRIESLEVPAESDPSQLPQPERVCLFAAVPPASAGHTPSATTSHAAVTTAGRSPEAVSSKVLRSLHPLLLYDHETAEPFFLSARRGERRSEHLCYTTGRVLRSESLGADCRELMARVLARPLDVVAAEAWAAQSEAEEPAEPTSDSTPARRSIGEFELLSRIGRGGMGMVYRAWQPSLGRQVALKCLLRTADPRAEARFAREIRALGRVEHPNVVKIFTSGSEGDQWFYAMELVEGADLGSVCDHLAGSTASEISEVQWQHALSTACTAARTKEEPLSKQDDRARDTGSSAHPTTPSPPQAFDATGHVRPGFKAGRGHIAQAVEVVRQTAEAAHALHEAGVVHRDIKPGNIMLTPDGSHAVLMDLGLAQLADETDGRLTRTRQFVGTLRYASPEQVLSVPLDRRSDVYSLGATLWELLTLRSLFGATDQTPTPELMLQIQSADPDQPSHLNPRVPRDLEAIVLKCLEKDRSRRYSTAADLAADLARWQHGEPVVAQPPTLRYLMGKYVRRYRVALTVVAGLILLALSGTAAAFYHVNRARLAAEAARLEAEKSFRQARKAVDDYFTHISESKLLDVPGLQPLRKELLESALKYYQDFLGQRGDDPTIQSEVALAYNRVGLITDQIGSKSEAVSAFERAIEVWDKLVRESPTNLDFQSDLGGALNNLANRLSALGRESEAQEAYRRAIEHGRTAFDQAPQVSKYGEFLANHYNNLGLLQARTAEPAEALLAYQQAVAIQEQLIRQNPAVAGLQDGLAMTYLNIADLQSKTGHSADALPSCEHALDIQEPLAREHPNNSEFQKHLAFLYNNLAILHRQAGHLPEALGFYRQAVGIQEKLARASPMVIEYQSDLAATYHNLGILHRAAGNPAEALRSLQQAIAIREKLAGDKPSVTQFQSSLASSYHNLGKLQRATGELTDALRSYGQAVVILEKLASENPAVTEFQTELASGYVSIGIVESSSGQLAEALQSYEAARAIQEKLVRDQPGNLNYRSELGGTLNNIGLVLRDLGRPQEAVEAYQKAIEHQRVALDQAPQDTQFRSFLSKHYGNLAEVQRELGGPVEAVQASLEHKKLWPANATELYNAACEIALCVPLVGRGKSELSSAEQADRRKYADDAVETLREAIAAGFKNFEHMRKDPDLEAIRDHSGYREIVARTSAAP